MKQRLVDRVDWRVTVTIAVGIVVAVGMLLLEMEPRLVLVGFVVMAVGATTWLAIDLGPRSAPVIWTDHGRGTGARPAPIAGSRRCAPVSAAPPVDAAFPG